MPGLLYQLHHWLEEVDVETSEIINAIESFHGSSRVISVIANKSPYHRPVFLLHMTAIVLLIGAGASEDNPLPSAIIIEMVVNELTAIVRVQAEQEKRQSLPHSVDSTTNTLLSFPPYPYAF